MRDAPEMRIMHGSPEERRKVLTRLRSIAGHLEGVERMVSDGAYCIDIVRQTLAIQRALDRVNAMLLGDHLEQCVTRAMQSGDERERRRVIREILDVFETSSKL
ncbi:MAG: metal-sensitive transcriptional regulator [Armatimonadota bacterium]|nr:metal-sensitive transcriptional regulator [Armatimonadota bacterium]MDR7427061.1 metal-sensitive transcriptional regulator [Armatimonadota bacterium]MDR7465521.1 metal-sensitive transcriptional regulator [Armatimonadota bacterium]MDR7468726.1 metal-sensitive transcriptional regulator [Armatimonadota bacterium]MDR7474829.1 metal-sensitive transcriptional regulator [Armatimonadota bacterium]